MHLDPKAKAEKIKQDFYPQMSQMHADEQEGICDISWIRFLSRFYFLLSLCALPTLRLKNVTY